MIGILTEKPSAKRNFIKAFGSDKGKINGEDFVIVNALGHLYQLRDPKFQVDESLKKKYSSWNTENLPWNHNDLQWKYSTPATGKTYLKDIKDKLSKCTEIVIATDSDDTGEGDLLAAEIIFGLKLDKKKLTRMSFVDESAKSIKKAFSERKEIPNLKEYPSYQKAFFRSRWDYLSMQLTRIASNVAPFKTVVRQGRLKSVMVYLVGEQLKLNDSYEEIPFYQAKFIDENGIVYTNPKEKKYDNKEDVPKDYKESDVVIDSKEIKTTPPPKLMDLAKLSSVLAPKGYSASEVQQTYQKMYQDGILSYPRTDDKNITYEQFNEMLPIVDKIALLVNIDSKKLTVRKPRKTHVKNKGAHGANRPGLEVPSSIKTLEKYGRAATMIYKTLAKNFLAMFAEDYEYEHQKGHIKDYPDFKGLANIPTKNGWKDIFKINDDGDSQNEENSEKGLGTKGKPFVFEGFPPRPKSPTQGWLMTQLEKYNVGSGSTRNSTFAEITNRKSKYPLMESNRGKLSMTPIGLVSHQLLEGTKISKVETSEHVISTMGKIESGNFELIEQELKAVEELIKHDLKMMTTNSKNIKLPEYEKKEKEEVKMNGENISFNKSWGGHTFTEEEISKLSAGETITIPDLKNKRGKKYSATGKLEKQSFKGSSFWGFKMAIYQEEGKDPMDLKAKRK